MTASDSGAPVTTKVDHVSDFSSGTCPPIFQLADFGDVTTLKNAQDAFAAATKAALSCQPNSGGVIQISPQTTPDFTVRSSARLISVIDDRDGVRLIQVSEEGTEDADVLSGSAGYPRATALLRRTRTDVETTYPRGNDAAQAILQRTIHGASSISTTLLFPVLKNTQNAKWYPRGITGFFVGQRFVATASGNTNYTVTDLGWDPNPPPIPSTLGPSGPLPYFVAHTHDADIPAGDLVTNKSFLNSLSLVTESHCGNQCAGALTIQHSAYGQGDTFGVSQRTFYMGDVISAGGDEGGVGFAAEIIHDLANFRATVSDFAVGSTLPPPTTGLPQTPTGEGTLTYELGSNTERLGTCRPIINLHPDKWISTAKGGGQIRIWGPNQRHKNDFEKYGVIEGVGTHWTNHVVGRYIAVEEASEYFEPGDGFVYEESPPQARVRRWFRIHSLSADSEGIQLLYVATHTGGDGRTVPGCPQLTDNSKAAQNGGPPLNYIIAPGAIVSDVSLGVHENDNINPNQGKLVLQPSGDFGTAEFEFAKGDPIEQAIGPAPWNPTGFRVRHVTNMPSHLAFGEFSYLSENIGTAPVQVAFGVGTSPETIIGEKHRNGYAYESAFYVGNVVRYGLRLAAEIAYLKAIPGSGPYFMGAHHPGPDLFGPDAGIGILFAQGTGNRKVIAWSVEGNDGVFATLGYDPKTRDYYARGGVTFNIGAASLTQTRGISATDTKSVNLRGINVPVPDSARQPEPFMDVMFMDHTTSPSSPMPSPEENELYGLQITPSWKTQYWITKTDKTKTGFRVNFDQPAPTNASIDWFLVR